MNTSAQNYVNALFASIDTDLSDYKSIVDSLDFIITVLNESEDLQLLLNSKMYEQNDKLDVLDDIFRTKVPDEVLNLIKILLVDGNINLLGEIVNSFKLIVEHEGNIKHVFISSAIEVPDNLRKTIIDKLSEKLSANVVADWNVDKSILGGLVIKYDDFVVDMSVKYKLDKLKKGSL